MHRLLAEEQFEEVRNKISVTKRDLQRVTELSHLYKHNAEFFIAFLDILQLFVEVKQKSELIAKSKAIEVLELTYKLNNSFLGLTSETYLEILELRLFANMLLIVAVASDLTANVTLSELDVNNQSAVSRTNFISE